MRELGVAWDDGRATVTARVYPADGRAHATLMLAHGAGAGQHSAFMVGFAEALAALGLDVVTFNFLYTEQKRKVPDRTPVLEACYRAAIAAVLADPGSASQGLFIGGKSMGGRIATHVVAADPALPVDGLVLLGYPLHPPGRADQRRDAHLPDVRRPTLFVQGERDAFGTPGELQPALEGMQPPPVLHVVEGGDHSFKVPRAGAAGLARTHAVIQERIAEWTREVTAGRDAARGMPPPPR